MSKNPLRRLGAGERDAEEIKEHEFFKGIKWETVYQRKLKPSKPDIRCVKPLSEAQKRDFEELI